MSRVHVLGGGVAGITAAFGFADRGERVTLLESHHWLGGRAFSFVDRSTGGRLDNGPHVMLGCYRAMRNLLRRLGTEDRFRADRRLEIAYRWPGGRRANLVLPRWPVPLAMPFALLGLRIGFPARLRALWGMVSTAFGTREGENLADWLRRRRQGGMPTECLWEPLCRAIMNVEPAAAAAADFVATLREAFGGPAADGAFWIPRAGWSELLGDPAIPALETAGVDVRLGARVVSLEREGDRVRAIILGDGTRLSLEVGDTIVSALPWHVLARLLDSTARSFGELRSSPIVTAHFALEEPCAEIVDEGPVVALPGGDPFHFVLRTPGGDPRRFALLAGGNRALDGLAVGDIAAAAREQVAGVFPGFDAATAGRVRISKENRATFVASPGSEGLRPRPGRLPGGPDNLLVCGDWTATGLPATLEGAARSAEAVLAAASKAGL